MDRVQMNTKNNTITPSTSRNPNKNNICVNTTSFPKYKNYLFDTNNTFTQI